MFKRLMSALSPASALNAQRQRLYGRVVAQARSAELYSEMRVPDTFDGRLSMMILHLYPIHRRFRLAGDKKSGQLSQGLFDAFFEDMDAALREAAVGDQAVPKRLAKVTRVFYGHAKALDVLMDGAAAARQEAMEAFLASNLIDPDETAERAALGRYLLASYDTIEAQPLRELASVGPTYAPFVPTPEAV